MDELHSENIAAHDCTEKAVKNMNDRMITAAEI